MFLILKTNFVKAFHRNSFCHINEKCLKKLRFLSEKNSMNNLWKINFIKTKLTVSNLKKKNEANENQGQKFNDIDSQKLNFDYVKSDKNLILDFSKNLLSKKLMNYVELMRLEKPLGFFYLFIPCLWSCLMGAYNVSASLITTSYTLFLFSLGALFMRSAGCIINDLIDYKIDKKVSRTSERPIANGLISKKNAFYFLGFHCLSGLTVLCCLPSECFVLAASVLPIIIIYPFFKRFTYYPQFMLSTCFSWGCLLGFPAIGAPPNLWVSVPLFISNWIWCLIYDTVYAHQDKIFDLQIGVKSTALKWNEKSPRILKKLYILQLCFFNFAGYMNSMSLFFYLTSIIGFKMLYNELKKVNLNIPKSCWKFFKKNTLIGFIFSIGMFLDYLWKFFLHNNILTTLIN